MLLDDGQPFALIWTSVPDGQSVSYHVPGEPIEPEAGYSRGRATVSRAYLRDPRYYSLPWVGAEE